MESCFAKRGAGLGERNRERVAVELKENLGRTASLV